MNSSSFSSQSEDSGQQELGICSCSVLAGENECKVNTST